MRILHQRLLLVAALIIAGDTKYLGAQCSIAPGQSLRETREWNDKSKLVGSRWYPDSAGSSQCFSTVQQRYQ